MIAITMLAAIAAITAVVCRISFIIRLSALLTDQTPDARFRSWREKQQLKSKNSNGLSQFGVLTLATALTRRMPSHRRFPRPASRSKVFSGMNDVGFRQTEEAGI
ncbi:MAG: hypothetical protein M9955_01895 [Rhizobiaceae bacterium]|nr:hypothetical protein [Rhizobiaceae bacterium]